MSSNDDAYYEGHRDGRKGMAVEKLATENAIGALVICGNEKRALMKALELACYALVTETDGELCPNNCTDCQDSKRIVTRQYMANCWQDHFIAQATQEATDEG